MGLSHGPLPSVQIVGLGETLYDCFPEQVILGGAPVNFAFHAHQLFSPVGGRGVIVSRIGTDELGQRLLKELDSYGIHTSYVQCDSTHPTASVRVELNDGSPTYHMIENVAFTDDLERLAEACDAVCFGTVAQRATTSRVRCRRLYCTQPTWCGYSTSICDNTIIRPT